MNKVLAIFGIIVAVATFIAANSLFTVRENQQALVFQFGELKDEIQAAGLHWKLPFVQDVVFYDKRVLSFDPKGYEVLLSGQERLVVDAFARYQIVDPGQFYRSLKTIAVAEQRLDTTLNNAVRTILAEATQKQVLSEGRVELMAKILERVRGRLEGEEADAAGAPISDVGIKVIDVRIRAADLPPQIQQNVYRRMESERQQEAARIRAEGEQKYRRITAEADAKATVVLAEAERDAQRMRGDGDQEAISIYAEAFGRDPEFYAFYRSLEAYRNALADGSTTMVLSPESEFFRFFGSQKGQPGVGAGR